MNEMSEEHKEKAVTTLYTMFLRDAYQELLEAWNKNVVEISLIGLRQAMTGSIALDTATKYVNESTEPIKLPEYPITEEDREHMDRLYKEATKAITSACKSVIEVLSTHLEFINEMAERENKAGENDDSNA